MLRSLRLLFGFSVRCFHSRQNLLLENLALRQQLAILKQRHPQPRLGAPDRIFWVILRRFWSGWKRSLLVVQPETVVRWHRAGSKQYWSWISRRRVCRGRRATSKELIELIFRMMAENPTWGAPRVHGELRMLGFEISERTVLRWMRKAPRDPGKAQSWKTFLDNHREAIAAMDFFSVPTLTFGVLYCFFVIAHDRRRVLHFNVTRHPTSAWVSQQLREAFPYDAAPKYLIHDRDAIFGTEVVETIKTLGVQSKRMAFKSPWQNGIAERFVGCCRRDLLDRVIVLNERHLKRLIRDYVRYYHDDRTHLGLAKQTPASRRIVESISPSAKIVSMPKLGGLHHRYDLAARIPPLVCSEPSHFDRKVAAEIRSSFFLALPRRLQAARQAQILLPTTPLNMHGPAILRPDRILARDNKITLKPVEVAAAVRPMPITESVINSPLHMFPIHLQGQA